METSAPTLTTSPRRGLRLAALGVALVLSVGSLAACGGSSTTKSAKSTKSTTATSSSASTTTSSTTSATTSSSTSAATNTGAQYAKYYKPNGSATITPGKPLTIQVGNTLTFKPNTLTVAKGAKVVLDFVNSGSLQHNFSLDAVHVSVTIPANGKATASFTAPSKPGTYYFYCNVPGHAQGGMVGKLIVH